MTENKPIMIDGVDVSGCEAYKDEHCKDKTSIMFCSTNLCLNFPNCYFKQLARKTQECEELKKQLIQKDEVNTFFNTPIEGWDNDPCKICESKQNYDLLKATKEQAEQKIEKIKDRCNETLELMNKDSGTNAYAGGRCIEAGQILYIIDEVE